MPDALRGRAPAKVNLVLEVLGKRGDGFHEIDTVLQELELADRVTMEPSNASCVEVSGAYAAGTPTDGRNLALRAFELAAAKAGFEGGVTLRLEKYIPAAGGLGGGASDAACVLRLVREWMLGLTSGDLVEIANSLGSDEAFFLEGGTARATGRGETVTRLPLLPVHDVILFVPPETIEQKTPRMFSALGRTPFDSGKVARQFAGAPPQALRSADVFNAFERVAFDLFPRLAALWEDLEGRIGEPVRLAGAGPSLFWIGPAGEGAAVAERAQGAACTIIQTRTVGPR